MNPLPSHLCTCHFENLLYKFRRGHIWRCMAYSEPESSGGQINRKFNHAPVNSAAGRLPAGAHKARKRVTCCGDISSASCTAFVFSLNSCFWTSVQSSFEEGKSSIGSRCSLDNRGFLSLYGKIFFLRLNFHNCFKYHIEVQSLMANISKVGTLYTWKCTRN